MHDDGKGYVEDRRPASNIDAYTVTAIIYDTGVLDSQKGHQLTNHYLNWTKWLETAPIEKP